MSARFRPLSTRVLCTLKLHALNPADTSWLPFNYYVGEQWRMHCLNRALQAHSHPYSKVVLQQAQASTAPPGTGQTYVHTQLLTQNGQYYTVGRPPERFGEAKYLRTPHSHLQFVPHSCTMYSIQHVHATQNVQIHSTHHIQ